MPRICHFEIQADDPQRAMEFYSKALGWTFQAWGGPMEYWMIITGPDSEPGINGGLMRRNCPIDGVGVIAYVCVVSVPSVDDCAQRVTESGGTIVVPKMAIPGVGWLAYAKDTEGNIFGFMQEDAGAK